MTSSQNKMPAFELQVPTNYKAGGGSFYDLRIILFLKVNEIDILKRNSTKATKYCYMYFSL